MSEIIVRAATKEDLPRLQEICDITASPGLNAAKDRSIIPAIWCTPYIGTLPAGFGFVLEDTGSKTVLGYIIGTLDTREYIKQYKEHYLPILRSKYPDPNTNEGKAYAAETFPGMEWILSGAFNPEGEMYSELLEEGNTAHLHIDIDPKWQGKGLGVRLLKRYEEYVKKNGGRAYHLKMDEKNDRAGVWYERQGLTRRYLKQHGRWMAKEF